MLALSQLLERATVPALLGTVVVAVPLALLAVVAVTTLLDRRDAEATIARAVVLATSVGLVASLGMLAHMLATGSRGELIDYGDWLELGAPGAGYHYTFDIEFRFDRLSVPFAVLTFLLCGTVGTFGHRYLHREPGYARFYVLFALFLAGMVFATLAASIETLLIGWELVGLSSMMLVGFFHERTAPVENALRVWVVYRVSDAALLLVAVLTHEIEGEGGFARLLGAGDWPAGRVDLSGGAAFGLGLLVVVAAAGKSALVPFSGWLPRAMEGPTPSSAIFYGALSVHLGAYLLLRLQPMLMASWPLMALVVALGLATSAVAALAARVQTDVKSALSFASLTQVGLIVAEIGVGWSYVPLVHILGHACLRTLQFIRAPMYIHDHKLLEDQLGDRLPDPSDWHKLPAKAKPGLYRLALERGYLDTILERYAVGPFVRLARAYDRFERGLIAPRPDPVGIEPPSGAMAPVRREREGVHS